MKVIYVFRVDNGNGFINFWYRYEHNGDKFGLDPDLGGLAKYLRKTTDILLGVGEVITIRFKPRCNILCIKGHFPLRCFKLSPKEQNEFWKNFNKKE